MTWGFVAGAAITAVGAAVSSNNQKKAAGKSASAAQSAANASLAEQQRQFDATQENMRPFQEAGVDALGRQRAILDGNYTGFQNSPDYAFTLEQGQKFMDRGAASRGSLYSSGHSADMQKYGQGLASQQLNNYWSKLAGIAGQGYNAGNSMAGYGQNYANSVGNINSNLANARASSYQQVADANSQFASGLANTASGLASQYASSRSNAQPAQAYTTNYNPNPYLTANTGGQQGWSSNNWNNSSSMWGG